MMACPRCNQPIDPTQPTATMTHHGVPLLLHARCGRWMQSYLRDEHLALLAQAKQLRRDVDSLRIVPAQETADDDGLRYDSAGELVWAI